MVEQTNEEKKNRPANNQIILYNLQTGLRVNYLC